MKQNTDFIQQDKILWLVLNDWFMVNCTVKHIWGLFTDRKHQKLLIGNKLKKNPCNTELSTDAIIMQKLA